MCNFWDMSLNSGSVPLPPVYFHLASYNMDVVASHKANEENVLGMIG